MDGKELARKTIKHTIPLLMSIDETFDVGMDTGTAVDDSYELPFKFTGTIDKLTFKLGPSQMTEADKKAVDERKRAWTTKRLLVCETCGRDRWPARLRTAKVPTGSPITP